MSLATEVFDVKLTAVNRATSQPARTQILHLVGRCPLIHFPETFGETRTRLYFLGAGHVGRALMLPLATLPFDVIWLDPRPDAFPQFVPENIMIKPSPDPVAELQIPAKRIRLGHEPQPRPGSRLH